jgi:orotidine-5'-phosphate decarboxylase
MSKQEPEAKDRLIVALDVADVAAARKIIDRIGDGACFFKIGYRLGFAGGLELARELIGEGKRVFLDFKLHDIGNTVKDGVASLSKLGADFLTVHGFPQTMKAAVEGRGRARTRILAVTVMTSYDDSDLREAGYDLGVSELVRRRARQALDAGCDGLITSPKEVAELRALVGPDMLLVTPGIRPAGADQGDQKRVMTPAEAIAAGADYLVVGRPVIAATDPRGAARAIIEEIEQGLALRAKAG